MTQATQILSDQVPATTFALNILSGNDERTLIAHEFARTYLAAPAIHNFKGGFLAFAQAAATGEIVVAHPEQPETIRNAAKGIAQRFLEEHSKGTLGDYFRCVPLPPSELADATQWEGVETITDNPFDASLPSTDAGIH